MKMFLLNNPLCLTSLELSPYPQSWRKRVKFTLSFCIWSFVPSVSILLKMVGFVQSSFYYIWLCSWPAYSWSILQVFLCWMAFFVIATSKDSLKSLELLANMKTSCINFFSDLKSNFDLCCKELTLCNCLIN